MKTLEDKKEEIKELIADLFRDTSATDAEQLDAYEELAYLCEERAEVLREQARMDKR